MLKKLIGTFLLVGLLIGVVGCFGTKETGKEKGTSKLILNYSGNVENYGNEIVIQGKTNRTYPIYGEKGIFEVESGEYKIFVKGDNIISEEKEILINGIVEEELNFTCDIPDETLSIKRVPGINPVISSITISGGEIVISGSNFGIYDSKKSNVLYTDKNGLLKKLGNFTGWTDNEIKINKDAFSDGEYGIYVRVDKFWSMKYVFAIGAVVSPVPVITTLPAVIIEKKNEEIKIEGTGFDSEQGKGKVLVYSAGKVAYAEVKSWSNNEIIINNNFTNGEYKVYIKNKNRVVWSNGVKFVVSKDYITNIEFTTEKIEELIDVSKLDVKPSDIDIKARSGAVENMEIKDVSTDPIINSMGLKLGEPIEIVLANGYTAEEIGITFDVSALVGGAAPAMKRGAVKPNINDMVIGNYDRLTNKLYILETVVDPIAKKLRAVSKNIHGGVFMIIDVTYLNYTWDIKNTSSTIERGKADVVFAIDTTGSMGEEIEGVRNNIISFSNQLFANKVDARLGLIDFKDIMEDGLETTKNLGWFIDSVDFKVAAETLYANGGGDEPESDVDALEEARRSGIRVSSGKYIVLVTDASYKEENRFGVKDMSEEIELLKKDGIATIVVASSYLSSMYSSLYNETGGIFTDINNNFSDILLNNILPKITSDVSSGFWIRLANGTIVKLNKDPLLGDKSIDTDGDGISDLDELQKIDKYSFTYHDGLNLILVNVDVWDFITNPAMADTDGDGVGDKNDNFPNDYTKN